MNVYWLEQTEAEVPADNDWLSENEILCRNGLRFPKRRADWQLGRWTAKCAVAACLKIPTNPEVLERLEIRARPSGAPQVFVANKPIGLTISLSHREGHALCAVARTSIDLGCDLENIEPRSNVFVSDYFTAEEQAMVAARSEADRPQFRSSGLECEGERPKGSADWAPARYTFRLREFRCGTGCQWLESVAGSLPCGRKDFSRLVAVGSRNSKNPGGQPSA